MPITLKFKDAKIKEVFNILSQLSGINFIFDEGLKDINVSIFLENATFQQALDILTGINKLGKKVLNESTIIVYPKTPDKSKQYDDLMVETFQLNKLDAKKAVKAATAAKVEAETRTIAEELNNRLQAHRIAHLLTLTAAERSARLSGLADELRMLGYAPWGVHVSQRRAQLNAEVELLEAADARAIELDALAA